MFASGESDDWVEVLDGEGEDEERRGGGGGWGLGRDMFLIHSIIHRPCLLALPFQTSPPALPHFFIYPLTPPRKTFQPHYSESFRRRRALGGVR